MNFFFHYLFFLAQNVPPNYASPSIKEPRRTPRGFTTAFNQIRTIFPYKEIFIYFIYLKFIYSY